MPLFSFSQCIPKNVPKYLNSDYTFSTVDEWRLYYQFDLHYYKKQYAESITYLDSLFSLNPSFNYDLYDIAQAYDKIGRHDDALRYIQKAYDNGEILIFQHVRTENQLWSSAVRNSDFFRATCPDYTGYKYYKADDSKNSSSTKDSLLQIWVWGSGPNANFNYWNKPQLWESYPSNLSRLQVQKLLEEKVSSLLNQHGFPKYSDVFG